MKSAAFHLQLKSDLLIIFITIEIRDPSGKIERVTNEIAKELILRRIIKQLRGGQIQEKLVETMLKVLLKKLIKLASKKGLEIGLFLGTGITILAVPTKHLVKIIEKALPQNLLDKKSFIQVSGKKYF